jgi:hypothetical protein
LKKQFILRIKLTNALHVHDQDKSKNCRRLSGNQETKYLETFYQVSRFLDHTEEDSEIVPGSKYHDRKLFRVSFHQEINYREGKTKYRGDNPVNYTDKRCPNVRFNIHKPTIIGDFPINRFVQEAPENFDPNHIWRKNNNPKYFPHTPNLEYSYKQQNCAPNYKIYTYTEVRPQEITGVRRGSWRNRAITVY